LANRLASAQEDHAADWDAGLRMRADALAACVTALKLVPGSDVGITLEVGRGGRKGGRRADAQLTAPAAQDHGVNPGERHSVVRSVGLAQVEAEFATARALEVLGRSCVGGRRGAALTRGRFAGASVGQMVAALAARAREYDLALQLAARHGAGLAELFRLVAERCVRGEEDWETCRGLLERAPADQAAGVVLQVVLDAVLDSDARAELPRWLLAALSPSPAGRRLGLAASGGDPVMLLAALLRRGRVLAACELAAGFVPQDLARLADAAHLRDAPWMASEVLDHILDRAHLIVEGGMDHTAVDVVDEDDVRQLRVALAALEKRLCGLFEFMAKVEPGRAALLKNLA
jgi:hypothetical protein